MSPSPNMGDYRDIDGTRYYMLPQDLDEGAGGDDIFFEYSRDYID